MLFQTKARDSLVEYKNKLNIIVKEIEWQINSTSRSADVKVEELVDQCTFIGRSARAIASKQKSMNKIFCLADEKDGSDSFGKPKPRRFMLRSAEKETGNFRKVGDGDPALIPLSLFQR